MVFVDTYDAFEKWAESIYMNAPMRTLCMMKRDHSKSCLEAKVTVIVGFEQWSTRAKKTVRLSGANNFDYYW